MYNSWIVVSIICSLLLGDLVSLFCESIRFPLKAVKVMHTVALRTESSMPKDAAPPNPTAAFKVLHVYTKNGRFFVFLVSWSPGMLLLYYKRKFSIVRSKLMFWLHPWTMWMSGWWELTIRISSYCCAIIFLFLKSFLLLLAVLQEPHGCDVCIPCNHYG